MKKLMSPDRRLTIYREAVRTMREGTFAITIPPTQEDDPLGQLGLELKDLAERLERRFDELSRLQEIATRISMGVFIHEVLDYIYDIFHKVIPYDRIGYSLIMNDGKKARAFWHKCNYVENIRITEGYTERLAGSSLETILATGEPRILNDLKAYSAAHPKSVSTRLIVEEGIQSSLTCPLIVDGRPIGFLFFSSRESHTYRDEHKRLFIYIATQVSCVIQKSLLYQQIFDLNQQLLESQQQLKELASRDALTGILNRGTIMEFLKQQTQLADRKKLPMAVIMADVDSFKTINDTHGHPVGDSALQMVARTIESSLRAYDRAGRFGGEEFLIILGEADTETAFQIAERVREAVATHNLQHEGQTLTISLSLGVACREVHGKDSVDQLLIKADAALYKAKREGRNRVCLADSTVCAVKS